MFAFTAANNAKVQAMYVPAGKSIHVPEFNEYREVRMVVGMADKVRFIGKGWEMTVNHTDIVTYLIQSENEVAPYVLMGA